MKKFIDLLAYEIQRIRIPYLLLIGAILVGQLFSVFAANSKYVESYDQFIGDGGGTLQDYLASFGGLSYLDAMKHPIYLATIFLGIFSLGLYIFVIWYRDWLGKGSLSNRLLLLPGGRLSIFASKVTTIFMLVMGLLATQVFSVFLGNSIMERIAPIDVFVNYSVIELIQGSPVMMLILPSNMIDFGINYLIGFTVVFVLFMMIIIEMSFKKKGILIDFVIAVVGLTAVLGTIQFNLLRRVLPMERVFITIFVSVVISILATFVSKYLLEKKISV